MTAEERELIRVLIDRARRTRVERELASIATCRGCGTEMENYTWGCSTCDDRRITRRRREVA